MRMVTRLAPAFVPLNAMGRFELLKYSAKLAGVYRRWLHMNAAKCADVHGHRPGPIATCIYCLAKNSNMGIFKCSVGLGLLERKPEERVRYTTSQRPLSLILNKVPEAVDHTVPIFGLWGRVCASEVHILPLALMLVARHRRRRTAVRRDVASVACGEPVQRNVPKVALNVIMNGLAAGLLEHVGVHVRRLDSLNVHFFGCIKRVHQLLQRYPLRAGIDGERMPMMISRHCVSQAARATANLDEYLAYGVVRFAHCRLPFRFLLRLLHIPRPLLRRRLALHLLAQKAKPPGLEGPREKKRAHGQHEGLLNNVG
mmetsp:Transcript_79143/g.157343  ORF Transcript_79143/g.157343 Transcript_79143/m.157343 type:complete len:313 (-) Transcript_79143:633-1571(-)